MASRVPLPRSRLKGQISIDFAPPKVGKANAVAGYKEVLVKEFPGLNVANKVLAVGRDEPHRQLARKFVHKNETTTYEPELQALRWLSGMARQWLVEVKGLSVMEVQALYDERTGKVWMASNKNVQTKLLADGEWLKWAQRTNVSAHDDEVALRFDRQVGKYHADLEKARTAAKSLEQVPDLNGCQPCREGTGLLARPGSADAGIAPEPEDPVVLRRRRILMASQFVYPVVAPSRDMHAEAKLVHAWRETGGVQHAGAGGSSAGATIGPRPRIHVAGVMRPCLCCFSRLNVHRRQLDALGVDLHYKSIRPGPFWVSKSALYGMTKADHDELRSLLAGDLKIWLSKRHKYSHDSDSSPDQPWPRDQRKKRPLIVTKAVDGNGDEGEEMEQDGAAVEPDAKRPNTTAGGGTVLAPPSFLLPPPPELASGTADAEEGVWESDDEYEGDDEHEALNVDPGQSAIAVRPPVSPIGWGS